MELQVIEIISLLRLIAFTLALHFIFDLWKEIRNQLEKLGGKIWKN